MGTSLFGRALRVVMKSFFLVSFALLTSIFSFVSQPLNSGSWWLVSRVCVRKVHGRGLSIQLEVLYF